MIIYPAIDLRQGKCVRLRQGRFDQSTTYADDPIAVARAYAEAGAEWLHVVDLDGAKDGSAAQPALIRRIAAESGLKLQTGGGIRSEAQISGYLEGGIERVVIGSLALTNRGLVASWLDRFGRARIALALDVKPAGARPQPVRCHRRLRRREPAALAVHGRGSRRAARRT
jgi:phosphoribosylformimino-5-aminoimidazole carboxamide ribotide isomerase